MYTVSEDVDDDHYADLVETLRFLFDDEAETAAFERDMREYRRALFQLDPAQLTPARTLKGKLERKLQRVMVRTERLSITPDRNGMLDEHRPELDLQTGRAGELRCRGCTLARPRRRRRSRVLEVGSLPAELHGRLQARAHAASVPSAVPGESNRSRSERSEFCAGTTSSGTWPSTRRTRDFEPSSRTSSMPKPGACFGSLPRFRTTSSGRRSTRSVSEGLRSGSSSHPGRSCRRPSPRS